MLKLEGVTKNYGSKMAVSKLDLTIRPGEVFAFLGPNGAGKTTTIKMLVGLLRPTEGTVRIGGCDTATDPRRAAASLGYVPDEPFLYDKLSGREFLEFVARMHGLDPVLAARRIARESTRFSLDGFLDDLCESYSHGMRQRTVFASALLHDPAALIVDEPMVGLDPKSARLVKDLFRSLAAAGTTVFMSTHTLAVAEEIADRIGIVDHGKLKFLGTLDGLRRDLSLHHRSLEHLFLEMTDETNGAGAGGDGADGDGKPSASGAPLPGTTSPGATG